MVVSTNAAFFEQGICFNDSDVGRTESIYFNYFTIYKRN